MLVPVNATEYAWDRVSSGDREGLLALIQERLSLPKGEVPTPERTWISNVDGSYYLFVEREVPRTLHFSLQTLTTKQVELGLFA